MKNLWRILFLMTWLGAFVFSSAAVPEMPGTYAASAYSEAASF